MARELELATVRAGAALDRSTAASLVDALDRAVRSGSAQVLLDLEPVDHFDSAGLGSVIACLRRARRRGVEVKLRGLSAGMLDFFSLVSVERLTAPASDGHEPLDPISRVGQAVEPILDLICAVARTTGDVLCSLFIDPFRSKGLRVDRTVLEVDQAVLGALPIVILISFLLGLILAMQAFVQLRAWGAELYIADMVGVSVMTEIGPLMTAIIVAARSGASNAAQIGSMVVSEEVDALRQMGIDPVRFLVVPKVLSLGFAVVALGLVFDFVAMAGGALFSLLVANIELDAYQEQTQTALRLTDFLVATLKCLTFGLCIGTVGCALGLRAHGGSEGVGRATTQAVVLSVFLIIVIDSLFVTLQRMVLS